ncbi:type II toxin-antitoxin system PemK/MazF family toxin (plasmid) [Enterococcus sp. 22-H-5-01]|uniref:type II toxin-antitoxin system PemK/MazF family toxin n=1 Tax=Enterococcus sp. 22-H-5-01 TaxID=3418555 RepID=UPI003CFBD7C9
MTIEKKKYIPKKGDLVQICFDTSSENKYQKNYQGLVVSRYDFNRKTNLAVICPISSTLKKLPTRYTLPNELDTTGQILISRLETLDFEEIEIKKIESIPLQDMAKIDQIIEYIF